jgi:hypothetical protein
MLVHNLTRYLVNGSRGVIVGFTECNINEGIGIWYSKLQSSFQKL